MGVLEPEAVRRRNTSDKMTTEDAIGDTDKFLVQLATAIHIAVHYSNLDNILSNKEGQQTGKARARLTKATRKELAHHYHIWLWMLRQSHKHGDLRQKMSQWDQRFILREPFVQGHLAAEGGGAEETCNDSSFQTWFKAREKDSSDKDSSS